MKAHWTIDPSVVFLNHGSFGAAPRVVQEAQTTLRERMERNSMKFFLRDLECLLDESRKALGAFVAATPTDLAFVPNATTGVNAVLRSRRFTADDELLTTDHEYQACKNALDFVAEREGARVVVAKIPFPLAHEDEVVAAITAKITERTRLLLVDHVTSSTGLVLPIAKIAAAASARGVDVLVDGAHAPGMVDLSLEALAPHVAYYTANCHKWLCAPKGAAFLWVRKDKQNEVRPLVDQPRRDLSAHRSLALTCSSSTGLARSIRRPRSASPSRSNSYAVSIRSFAIPTARSRSKREKFCATRSASRRPRPTR